jgi:hypothetical protein
MLAVPATTLDNENRGIFTVIKLVRSPSKCHYFLIGINATTNGF